MQRQTQRPNLLRSAFVALALATSVAGCAAVSGRETPGEYVDDVTISTRVRTAILSEIGAALAITVRREVRPPPRRPRTMARRGAC
mgnify:CR=1 FL=1